MSWFAQKFLSDIHAGLLQEHPVAYFSAEFALSPVLPIYSGGLGVLAGDVIREAADLALPFVGVGLFYHRGYFIQEITTHGQQERYRRIDPQKGKLRLVHKDKQPLIVPVPLGNDIVYTQIWEYRCKNVSVYLLDTDIAHSPPGKRKITQQLYGGDRHMRIQQEIVLGIGGERALFMMGIHPWVYHMNEGHSAFAILEITHHVMGELQVPFEKAFKIVQDKMVFTNHTLVPAGNDVFEKKLVEHYLGTYAAHLGLSIKQVMKAGRTEKPRQFSMTMFAIRQSCRINTVSKLHEQEAKKHWPDVAMQGITNGVHMSTWIASDIQKLIKFVPQQDRYDLDTVRDASLWEVHQRQRAKLVRFITKQTNIVFNTEALTLVWARRFATYKRPEILFSEIDTLKRLAQTAHGALQIVIAGKAHPKDSAGKSIIRHIVSTIQKKGLSDWVVFLPNYDMHAAAYLVGGSDVWLNTPVRGHEASGTSGMKAAANGALQLSICDGWYDEVCDLDFGWMLDEHKTAKSIYDTLENDILPLFYERDGRDVPRQWVVRMKRSMAHIMTHYSSTRMLKEYVEQLYVPVLDQFAGDYHKTKRLSRM